MATVVLVHGAWQAPWCWERLVPLLEEAGHTVVTPTLAGCGGAGDMSAEVDLSMHIEDVTSAVEHTGADDVVLVLHSYAGMTAPAVAERVGERLRAVVFVDAFYPAHGESAIDQMPPPFQQTFRERARTEGDGWRLPATDRMLDVWGLHDEGDRRFVSERMTDWSLRCFESPSPASSEALRALPRWFVSGSGDYPAGPAFRHIAERAAADGASVVSVPTGHDVMIEAPDRLAEVIAEAMGATG